MGLIMNALPESKAIYIIRHPCGQIASVMKGEKSGNFLSEVLAEEDFNLFELLLDSNYAKKHSLTIEKIKEMKPVERSALRWVLYNEQAIEDIEQSNNRGMIVRYEDICMNPKKKTKQLYDFSGLLWNSQTEEFINQSSLGKSDAYFSVFKNPEVTMSKWRDFFNNEDIELIKKTISNSKAGDLYIEDF
jgi:hypothetical protein